jgi:cytochrome c oxidase assembly protein subunit 15
MAIAEILVWPSATVSSATVSSAAPAGAAVRTARLYFLIIAVLGLAAFVLGVENRLTPGLFPIAPPVDLLPPLGDQAWYAAFALHQQDPIFAACGGAESLAQFKLLYWWEWLRRGSVLLLAGTAMSGFLAAALLPGFRPALKPQLALCLVGLGYLAAGWCLDLAVANVEDLARYNVGQYRHAFDVTFGSVALALLMSGAIAPALPSGRSLSRAGWVWIGLIVLDIGYGALFASRDALSVWRSFPGYETGIFPPLERLMSYAPPWLNFTFNQYMIQFVHRIVSIGLWTGLIAHLIWRGRRDPRARMGAAVLFAFVTAEMAAGITTLMLGGSPAASFLHELGAIVLLAGAFVVLAKPVPAGSISESRACGPSRRQRRCDSRPPAWRRSARDAC